MPESTCRGCGKRIIWGLTRDGKKVPLDPAPPVYFLETGMNPMAFRNAEVMVRTATPDGGEYRENSGRMMVSHFVTCPKANEFSAAKKEPQKNL
jgi:hypothetical protein